MRVQICQVRLWSKHVDLHIVPNFERPLGQHGGFVDFFGEGGGYYDPKPYKPKTVGLLVLAVSGSLLEPSSTQPPKTFILGRKYFSP